MANQKNSNAPKRAPARGKRGNRSFVGILVVIAIVGLGTIGYVVSNSKPAIRHIDPNAPLPPAKGFTMGNATAPVEIIEYGDFECPICGTFAQLTEPDVREKLVQSGLARFTYIDYPIPSVHANTMVAHNAAHCAGAQNKFWEMHDKLYNTQVEWSAFVNGKDSRNPQKAFKRYAREIGADGAQFDKCLDDSQFEEQIVANRASGDARHVSGTPNFFVGARMFDGKAPYDVLKALVDSATMDLAAAAKAGARDTAKKKS